MLPFAVLAAHHWNWGAPPGFGDHAQYLTHARTIIERRPYTDIGYIFHPAAAMIGPLAYPPGFPLTLAPIVALFGVDSPAIRLLMIASVITFAYLAYRRLAMVVAPWQAAFAVAMTALALETRSATMVPLSDPGFCALLWGLVLAVDTTATWTWRRITLVTALGFAAMAYRVPGVVVIPALTLYAIIRWREHRWRAFVPVAIWGAAGVAVLLVGAVDLPFGANLIPHGGELANRIISKLPVYRAAVFDLELYAFPRAKLNNAYHAVASLALVAGTAALMWRYRRTMLTATVLAYVALLVTSPVSDGRYLWPMYPVLAAGLVLGFTAASRTLSRYVPWYPRSAAPVAVALAIVMLSVLPKEMTLRPTPSFDRLPDAKSLYAWMRAEHAHRPMRAMFVNPRVLTMETDVPSMGALVVPPHVQIQALRELRITHVVWQSAETNNCRAKLLNSLPRIYPNHFALVYQNATFRVYRFQPTSATAADELAASFEVTPEVCRQLPRS